MHNYRDLKVWEKAHQLTLSIYAVTRAFPREELCGLTSQTRRACSSVPANLAEGCGRFGKPELNRFAQIALGSATELDYWLLLARDLGFLLPLQYDTLTADTSEVRRMLIALIRKLTTDD
jgi:four helix bundle protein